MANAEEITGGGKPTLLIPGNFQLGEGASAPPQTLPIDYITGWIRARLASEVTYPATAANRVLLVRAKTGSGKSTLMPVSVFRVLRPANAAGPHRGPGVACTQPRVLTAMTCAEDVSGGEGRRNPNFPDMVLGETVGYQTKEFVNKPAHGLIYMTAGVLAAQLSSLSDADFMELWRVVIVDEAHERSVDVDRMVSALRDFYERNAGNPRLPFLILTSATFEPATYAGLFGVTMANFVDVAGAPFHITEHFLDADAPDFIAAAVERVRHIHRTSDGPEGTDDVIVFVPGEADIAAVIAALALPLRDEAPRDEAPRDGEAARAYARGGASSGASNAGPLLALPLSSLIVEAKGAVYRAIFAPPGQLPLVGGARPTRRAVVTTSVAETGLTIETLGHCVDACWSKTPVTFPAPWGLGGLIAAPAPRSRCLQRRGRVGRLRPGHYWPLVTAATYAALEPQQLPDIITSPGFAAGYLRDVAAQQRQKLRTGAGRPEFRLEDMRMLDPPPAAVFLAANSAAVALGFVAAAAPLAHAVCVSDGSLPRAASVVSDSSPETHGYGLTGLGVIASRLTGVSMEAARILLAGYVYGCAGSDLLTIAALVSAPLGGIQLPATRKDSLVPALRDALPPWLAGIVATPPAAVKTYGGDVAFEATTSTPTDDCVSAGAPGKEVPIPAILAKPPPTADELLYLRVRVAMGDDFLETLYVFEAWAARLSPADPAADPADPAAAADAWAEGRGLSANSFAALAEARATIAEGLMLAGLDPYHDEDRRLALQPIAAFADAVRRLKRCIYDGLRQRLLRFDEERNVYYTVSGVATSIGGILGPKPAQHLVALQRDAHAEPWRPPRWIVTDRLVLDQERENGVAQLRWRVNVGRLCALDGYVAVDPDFDAPNGAIPNR
jgi:HrpA-like RNA helicase